MAAVVVAALAMHLFVVSLKGSVTDAATGRGDAGAPDRSAVGAANLGVLPQGAAFPRYAVVGTELLSHRGPRAALLSDTLRHA